MSSARYDRSSGGGPRVASYGGGRYHEDDDEGGGFGSSVTSREHTRRDVAYGGRSQPPTGSSQSLPLGSSRGRESGYDGRGESSGYGYDGGRGDSSRYNSSLPASRTHREDPGYGGGGRGASYDGYGGGGKAASYDSYGGGGRYDSYGAGGRYDGYGGGGRYDGYSGGGRGASHSTGMVSSEDYQQRIQAAHRRMEQSSGNSLRVLHETERMGYDTVDTLEEQAETLDRVERRLDDMEVDLDQSKRHMRNIKSPFGGVMNYFARRKKVDEITDPKMPKGSSAAALEQKRRSSKGRGEPDRPPPSGKKSTGNDVVDGNLDQMEKALHRLKGVGVLIGDQLDDSEVQIDRVAMKMERTDVNMKGVNRDIKRQL